MRIRTSHGVELFSDGSNNGLPQERGSILMIVSVAAWAPHQERRDGEENAN